MYLAYHLARTGTEGIRSTVSRRFGQAAEGAIARDAEASIGVFDIIIDYW